MSDQIGTLDFSDFAKMIKMGNDLDIYARKHRILRWIVLLIYTPKLRKICIKVREGFLSSPDPSIRQIALDSDNETQDLKFGDSFDTTPEQQEAINLMGQIMSHYEPKKD